MDAVDIAMLAAAVGLSAYLWVGEYGYVVLVPLLFWYAMGTTVKGIVSNLLYGHPGDKIVPPPQRKAVSASEDANKPKIVIVFASQTGTAEMYAKNLSREAKKLGFNVRLEDSSDYLGESLYDDKFVVFIAATYGEGEPTDTAKDLHEWLMSEDRADDRPMSDLQYAVFGLGDRQYKHFCQIGKEFDQRLTELGGTRLYALGEGDSDQNMEEEFDNWKNGLWSAAADKFGIKTKDEFEEEPERQLTLKYHPKPSNEAKPFPVTASSLPPSQKIPCWGVVLRNDELLNGCADRSTKHIEIDCKETSLPQYEAGDHLGILPANSDETVEEYIKLLDDSEHPINNDEIVSLVSSNGMSQRNHLPNKVNVRMALKWYFDLQGVPKKSVLRAFTFHTKDKEEQERFRDLLKIKKESTEAYHNVVKTARTVAGFLKMFPSTKVPLDLFFEMMPRTQPRWYSIASDSLRQGKNVHMCLAVSEGGLASGYLKGMNVGDKVPCFIRKSTFHLPQRDKSRPTIMIGPGTGVAPLIGFIHRRMEWKTKGNALGACRFYFGCRKQAEDHIYADLMEQAVKEGVISDLRVAYSRDTGKKVYVQHLIHEDGAEINKLINENANIYICGDAKHMAKEVEETLTNILITHGGVSRDEAEAKLNKMEKSQRFLKDVWTSH
eukprot:TRINITY_DN13333_c0_g3_i1.p1 TRINITY_DN13333_c0_g3~~TRINITY_DN13333_c0_g3_i1.p1  ORF type:complete len:682 (+),score=268.70 TRINITY_DN13333_c0_g3_i1:59-2047(+)